MPLKTLLPVTFAPLLMLAVSSLPIAESGKVLLEGTLAGMQMLMVMSLYRAKTRKK